MQQHAHRWLVAGTLGLALLAPTTATADWMAFGNSRNRTPSIRVTGATADFSIEFDIPGVQVTEDEDWTHLEIPDNGRLMNQGEPELPIFTTSVLLPDQGLPRVDLVALEEIQVPLNKPIAPSHGHLTRDQNISEIERVKGPVYDQAGFFPASFQVEAGNPYVLREARGAALRVAPVLYDPATNMLRILTRARLDVTIENGAAAPSGIRRRGGVTPEFLPVYARLFANFQRSSMVDLPLEDSGRSVILAADDFVEAVQPLQAWRTRIGRQSKVVPMSEVGETAEDIRSYVVSEWEAGDLVHVLLVGDSDTVPTLKGEKEGADCDTCFVKLEGDDHVPDAYISRFSAKTVDEVAVQVNRAIRYERDPQTGAEAAWYTKATGIASHEGSPTDYERMEILRENLLDWRFTEVDTLYDRSYSDKVTPEQAIEAINDGRSLINYLGHGSKYRWVSSNFGTTHLADIQNGAAWPMIWDVACVNGDFVGGSDCFGEAWAKAGTPEAPQGAIGIVAASTNMSWHPPVDWQRFAVVDGTIDGVAYTGAALHHFGLVKAMEIWGDDSNSQGVMMVEQCIFFGDSSVTLRTDVPVEPTIEVDAAASTVKVLKGGEAVGSARVVLHKGENDMVVVTDAAGVATFDAGTLDGEGLAITVTGYNLVPVLEQEL